MYIIGGLIKTMAGADIRDGCIRIRDGKIAEIGKRDEVAFHPAPCERVIEVRDGLIMPGTIWGSRRKRKGWRGTTAMRRWPP